MPDLPPPDRPLPLVPWLRARVWGGRRLAQVLARELPPASTIGESWELYDRPEGASLVAAGPWRGVGLGELLAAWPEALLGPGAARGERFPLLIKLLDGSDRLSVQVHPDEAWARRVAGDGGKEEAWVVLAAEPGARVVRGLAAGVDPEEFRRLAGTAAGASLLCSFPVAPGEVVWLPPGTIHTLGGGLLLYEVQQNSDVTYRLYDWERPGLDGRPRELHLAEALAVARLEPDGETVHPPLPLAPGRELLVAGRAFRLERWRPGGPVRLGGDGRFRVVTATRGRFQLGPGVRLGPGDTALLPAAAGAVRVEPEAAAGELLVAGPPAGGSS